MSLVAALKPTGIHRRGSVRMSELDPVHTLPTGPRQWWHSVYGPMDPFAAQILSVMWQRREHGQQCPFYTQAGTPYDCDCWHRARAIVASDLIRAQQRDGRWTNVAVGIDPLAGRPGEPI